MESIDKNIIQDILDRIDRIDNNNRQIQENNRKFNKLCSSLILELEKVGITGK
jgi:hypothetical protein